MVTAVSWTALGVSAGRLRASPFLAGSAFFVYAYHMWPLSLCMKCWMKLWHPATELTMTAGYVLLPLAVTAAGVALYAMLRRLLPAFTRLITGGR